MKKLICILLISNLILCACSKKNETVHGFAMDTYISITVSKKDVPAAKSAIKKCRDYEKIFSRTDKKSELWKVNHEGKTPSGELLDVINFSLSVSEKSDGAFDITVAPLSTLWNVKERTYPPSAEEIANALKNVGYKRLDTQSFSLNGTTLDLGAIAKGYTADKIFEDFKAQGIKKAIIDLGGNIYVIGEYTVGIRSPFKTDEAYCTITLKDKSAVTSGAYQRYFDYEGKRYHHIIDPKTGYPSEGDIASVTVISPSSKTADALSTAIFVKGTDALSLCSLYDDTGALIIMNDGEIKTTEGFDEKYNLKK